jgi:uncharacterized lipoprotein
MIRFHGNRMDDISPTISKSKNRQERAFNKKSVYRSATYQQDKTATPPKNPC